MAYKIEPRRREGDFFVGFLLDPSTINGGYGADRIYMIFWIFVVFEVAVIRGQQVQTQTFLICSSS
jgi:hypothetical protein